MSEEEIKAIVLAEYTYWRDVSAQTEDETVSFGAMMTAAGCANILAAMFGHRAPWHPPNRTTKKGTEA